jgi:hypothetical protein
MRVPGHRDPLRRVLPIFLALILASLIAPPAPLAYVDPLSGSVIFQLLLAGLLGAAFTTKMWWSKAMGRVGGWLSRLSR